MSTLLEDLQTVLAPVAVGGAWYGDNEAVTPVYPFLVYTRVAVTPNTALSGSSALKNTRVQVDVYARSIAQAEQHAAAVVAAMASGPWNSCVQVSSEDLFDFEQRTFRVAVDFSIWATN